ncbi:hypothetical protein CHS0354_003223, partial [Potamilus streckersoni]
MAALPNSPKRGVGPDQLPKKAGKKERKGRNRGYLKAQQDPQKCETTPPRRIYQKYFKSRFND